MRKADPSDEPSSITEDPLCCPHGISHDPNAPEHPSNGISPLQEVGQMNVSCTHGCGAHVRPSASEPLCKAGKANGVSPVIGDNQAKQYPSKIARLFSNHQKSGVMGSERTPLGGLPKTPSTWSSLSSLKVMGSFKKLRSSVLQGIQSRGSGMATNQERDVSCMASEPGDSFLVTKQNREQVVGHNCNSAKEANGLSKRIISCEVLGRCSLDVSDEEEDPEEPEGLHRNSHFSRSIRRAYRSGRISLLDSTSALQEGARVRDRVVVRQRPCSTVEPLEPDMIKESEATVKALSRLSKSADNLHLFKSPFRRKVPTPQPQNHCSTGTPSIQRAASASSVDLRERASTRRKAHEHMRKLVGSLTDISGKHRTNSGPSLQTQQSVLSQLHDEYSRRTPCIPASERQRRPSLPQTRTTNKHLVQANTHEHTPFIHSAPSCPAIFDSSSSEPQDPPSPAARLSGNFEHLVRSSDADQRPGSDAHNLHQMDPCESPRDLQALDNIKVNLECIWNAPERDADEQEAPTGDPATVALLRGDHETLSNSSPTTPPATPTAPVSPGDTPAAVVPRRREGRSRPRPISDYAQLVSRKYAIPEEGQELQSEEMDYTSQEDYKKSNGGSDGEEGQNGHGNGQSENGRTRPISVIGGVELFSTPGAEEQESCDSLPSPVCRPPVPPHRVPPYRAVSVRLRPSALSQSTPIGLDRVGRRKMHRVLSDDSTEAGTLLDDSVSEEDGSFEELNEGTPYLQPESDLSMLNQLIKAGHAVHAEALWDHVTMGDDELAFKVGEEIRVLEASETGWWLGAVADRKAWFPSSFVRVRVNQEDSGSESVESISDPEENVPKDTRAQNTEHREKMRANVVREIMDTERVYIKHLRDICEGYIRQCKKHPGMFTEAQLKTIFSNIEEIYKFQRTFVKDLEKKYNKDQPHLSEIGSCFLQQGEGFSIYSEYCNTHPAACRELQRLMKQGRYKHFFEACRLLQQMIDISLAGFLLTPVQKICKYPLQLGELLKYTPKDHSDYRGVCDAHETMKNVASLINERKRRQESIDTIAHWQVSILSWEGEDVLSRSSELIHSGELTRIVRPGKTQQRSFFLFDHQLVFCKKDILRRDLLHYRGRLDTDRTELQDLPDGRDAELGLTLKHAFLLRNTSTQEVCVLCCRKPQDKQRWLQAFTQERKRVQEDEEMGMEISEAQRKQAIINARKAKQGKMKNMNYADHHMHLHHHQPLHPLHQRHVTVPTSIPQQQVFSLAEPKRKPAHLWYNFALNAFSRK